MGNCLVTKLKETVNNSELPVLGALSFKVNQLENATDNQRKLSISVAENETAVVKALGGGTFTRNGVSMNETSITNDDGSVALYFANGNYKVVIENKYAIVTIRTEGNSILSFNIDECMLPACRTLYLEGGNISSVGNIKSIKLDATVNQIRLEYNTEVSGDISAFSCYSALQGLMLRNTNISGDISNLGSITALVVFDIYGTNISGTIESFVAGQVTAGRSTESPITAHGITRCSFGGTIYGQRSRSFIEWSGTNKIIVYTGGSSVALCPNIYAKGATAEEITAWQAAGKTVTVIS